MRVGGEVYAGLDRPAVDGSGPERRAAGEAEDSAVILGDQPRMVAGALAGDSTRHLGGVGRLLLEADRAVLDVRPIDFRNGGGVVPGGEPDKNHSASAAMKPRLDRLEATGATGPHSRQRAWMRGPERIARRSAIIEANSNSGLPPRPANASAGAL